MNKQTILTTSLCAFILIPSNNVHADWKQWTLGGALAASLSGLAYWATRPASPDTVKRKAEEYFVTVVRNNENLVKADHSSEEIIFLVTEKGRTYRSPRWFINADNYLSHDCAQHAPLVRGYAALLEESGNLLSHRTKLIKCFGSEEAARQEYANFDMLEVWSIALQQLAEYIEQQSSFMVTRDAFNMHRSHMRKQETLHMQIAQMRNERAGWQHHNEKSHANPAEITPATPVVVVHVEQPKPAEPVSITVDTTETTNAQLYKYLTESI